MILKSGVIEFRIENPLITKATLELSLPGYTKDGIPLQRSLEIPLGTVASPGILNATIDLTGYSIDLTGIGSVEVEFQQKFRRCCANVPAPVINLSVSTDPTFATNVMDYDINGGISTNDASPDPMDMSINITAIAGGLTGDIYLRFHLVSGSSHYFWMIDDIAVVESPINDMVAINGFYGFFGVQYTRIPFDHVQPISFSYQANNIGVANQTNTSLSADISTGAGSVYSGNSTPITFVSLATDTFELDSVWTPSAAIVDWNVPYTVTLEIVSDSVDFTPANNGIIFPSFEVNEFIMALDDYSTTPGNGGGNAGPGGVTEYEAGNQFDATVADVLYGIDLVTGSNTPVGTFVDVVIYEIDFTATPAAYNELARTTPAAIVAGDIGVSRSFRFASAVNLTAGGTFFAAMHSFVDYEYGISGGNPPSGTPAAQHSAIRYPNMATPNANSSFGLSNTPMIRLNFDQATGLDVSDDNDFAFNVYPNPSNGLFNINLSSDEANTVQLSVKNLVGQTIINETVSVSGKTNHSISLANYSKGVYFLTVGNETVKLIVE